MLSRARGASRGDAEGEDTNRTANGTEWINYATAVVIFRTLLAIRLTSLAKFTTAVPFFETDVVKIRNSVHFSVTA